MASQPAYGYEAISDPVGGCRFLCKEQVQIPVHRCVADNVSGSQCEMLMYYELGLNFNVNSTLEA